MNELAGFYFWEQLAERFGKQSMLLQVSGQSWDYATIACEVRDCSARLSAFLPEKKGLCALIFSNHPAAVIAYLACLQSGHAMMLLHPEMLSDTVEKLCERYRVNLMIQVADPDQTQPEIKVMYPLTNQVNPDLAILLSTSGSSGSPKFVRLSYRNLQANAESIAEYLSLKASDRAIAHLSLHYSYGLSVLNSHLLVGASCVLFQGSVMERIFWQTLKTMSVSNIAGVPYTYEILARLRFKPETYPNLKHMTQAGGKLSSTLVRQFAEALSESGKSFYVMYGQTEATARMSYLSPELCCQFPDSIGKPIPRGRFELQDEMGEVLSGANQVGEIVYSGDNVMMGYAFDYHDLSKGNTLNGLATGDLGWRDEQGLYFLKGRKDRISKLYGNRIDLDELQSRLQAEFGSLACMATENELRIFYENEVDTISLKEFLNKHIQLPTSSLVLHSLEQLPRTVNGKLDYQALQHVRDD